MSSNVNKARADLDKKWEGFVSKHGIFDAIFGSKRSRAITHIRVTFPEAQDPVIFIQHPPASVAKPKYLTEAQLADLEATVRDNLPLLVESENRDVAEFGHRVYLQIAGYVLNEQGMECNLYLKWRQALREQRTTDLLHSEVPGVKIPKFEILAESSSSSSEPKRAPPHLLKQKKRGEKKVADALKKVENETKEIQRQRQLEEQRVLEQRRVEEFTAQREEQARLLRERNLAEREQFWAEQNRQNRLRQLNQQERIKALRAMAESELNEQEQALLKARKEITDRGFGAFYDDAVWRKDDLSYEQLRKFPKNYDSDMQLRCFYEYLEKVLSANSTLVQWSHTRLEVVPPLITLLNNTVELNLSHNAISQPLPQDLATSLPQLRRLYLRHNQLTVLPSLDAVAGTLELLDASNNKLTHVDDVSALTNLQTLELESNQLRFFPVGLDACLKLSHLNIRSNQIKLVPPELGLLLEHNLTFFAIRLNPITNIPPHIYLQGTRSTLTFLLKSSGLSIDEEEGSLHKDLGSLLREPFLADVEIQCLNGERLQAHSCLLKARSSAFRSLLFEAAPSKDEVRSLPLDISAPHAQMLLDFIYTDKFSVPPIELILAISANMEWHQVEAHNRVIKESYVAMMSGLETIALRFELPYLAHLIREAKLPYEEKKMRINIDAADSSVAPASTPLRASSQIAPSGTTSSWKEDFKWLMNDVQTHNVFFTCEAPNGMSTRFSAHRLILACRSPVMRAMLTGGMSESTTEAIQIPSKEFYMQQAIIEFCYMDDVEDLQILEDNGGIARLLVKALKMQLPRLQSILESIVGYSLDSDNALHFIQLAAAYQLPKLGRAAQYYIITHFEQIKSSAEYATLETMVRKQIDAMPSTTDFESFQLTLPSLNAYNVDD